MKKKKRGRPLGAITQDLPQVQVELSACPNCGSTDRQPYSNIRSLEMGDERVSWKRTACLRCGQSRIDKTVRSTAPGEQD